MKDKKNKVSFEEIAPQFIIEMARGMNVTKKENGGKYEVFNWTNHTNVEDYLDAIQRHLFDFRMSDWEEGNDLDEETGVSHLALIACNCMMAYYHVQTYKEESRTALKNFFKNDEDLEVFMDRYKDGSLWDKGYNEDENEEMVLSSDLSNEELDIIHEKEEAERKKQEVREAIHFGIHSGQVSLSDGLNELSSIENKENKIAEDTTLYKNNEFDFSKLKEFDGHVYLSGKEAFYKILNENKTIERVDGFIRYNRSMSLEVLKRLYDSETDNYYVV